RLTGFRDGRQVPPVPDGACDLTAHVAIASVAAAGVAAAGGAASRVPSRLLTQREALGALGVDGRRPPLELAHRDPRAYLAALARASAPAQLTGPAGAGGPHWLVRPRPRPP